MPEPAWEREDIDFPQPEEEPVEEPKKITLWERIKKRFCKRSNKVSPLPVDFGDEYVRHEPFEEWQVWYEEDRYSDSSIPSISKSDISIPSISKSDIRFRSYSKDDISIHSYAEDDMSIPSYSEDDISIPFYADDDNSLGSSDADDIASVCTDQDCVTTLTSDNTSGASSRKQGLFKRLFQRIASRFRGKSPKRGKISKWEGTTNLADV